MSRPRRIATAFIALVGAAVLAGCQAGPVPGGDPTPTASAGPSEAPGPRLDLEGTAGQNQAYFDLVNRRLIESGAELDGRAFIDNLVEAGFPKEAMEVTPDRTSINLEADNIQFAVQLNGTCLLGQYGNVGYASAYGPVLATGKCLVGETRPIDW